MRFLRVLFLILLPTPFFVHAQHKQPNIIFFMVDDMGWQDCSLPFDKVVSELNKKYHTPNMERLARRGMQFTNGYANPVCTPTRVSLMTGMDVPRHHITNWTNVRKDTPTDHPDSLLNPPVWNHNGMSPVAGVPTPSLPHLYQHFCAMRATTPSMWVRPILHLTEHRLQTPCS